MTEETQVFSKGSWVVHLYHGIGMVKGVVNKRLNGEKSAYYKIKTADQTIWVPVSDLDTDRIRPLAKPSEFKKALKILKSQPHEMDPDHNMRRAQIRKVRKDGSLKAICELIRDLAARKEEINLNSTDKTALTELQEQLLSEWTVCLEVELEQARADLNDMLEQGRQQED